MKVNGTICLLDATQKGVSKSTGNPWTSKEFVVEVTDDGGHRDTLAVKTMNAEAVRVLEGCMKGDRVCMDLGFCSRAKVFTRKDGTEAVIRSTEVYARSVEVTKQVAF